MTQKEQVMAWLNDTYSVEVGILRILENHANDAKDDPEMEKRLRMHMEETRQQAQRVRDCIERLGGTLSAGKPMLANIMAKMEGLGTGMFSDQPVKNVIMDYATEQFEIAGYRSLMAAATALDLPEVLEMARQNLREEEAMAEWLAGRLAPVTERFLQSEPVLA